MYYNRVWIYSLQDIMLFNYGFDNKCLDFLFCFQYRIDLYPPTLKSEVLYGSPYYS